ncbi:transporter substrate-binding domain-containing protein [Pseudomonas savastanoi]|uniref:Regulatory protein n=2 Tax=Pseudomonas syringae group genomosp. 2 TaxID=251698 RepID=A0A3M6A5I0_PSESS|nr:transporter substrate-binding domain-containing protein [Pseudomonas savastanoi]KPX08220.1 putative Regulatory protein [Pseudomonas syringae pv. cunninghamiae]RMV05672.1 Regulatory protein [Pseudomonas savastanoi]RMV12674.1 putative Regulatory protein [Pseudomonas savastanoi]RMV14565.1 putative Regulatory protein [Pseudomonas savastanoi]
MVDPSIRIGGLFSNTGVTAAGECSTMRGAQFAIHQINAAGGVNGRPLELITRNPDSTPALFAMHVESLIREENLRFFFGCYTSAARKAVLPVVERYNALLFYPVYYEGFEYSRNIIYTGATPNHNAVPLGSYMFDHFGSRVLMIGSEYVYPYETNRLMSDLLYERGGSKLGEYYLPLKNARPEDFARLMVKARELKPSFIFSTVVGDTMAHLYQAYADAGFDPAVMPIASVTTSETDIQQMGVHLGTGHISAATYFQSIDTPLNRQCIAQYREMFGQHQVTDRCWEAAYFQVHLLAKAIARAGSTEVEDVLQTMRGLEYDAPQGRVRIDEHNHHTYLYSRIGRANGDGQFDILYESQKALKPDPYAVAPDFNGWSSLTGRRP